MLSDWGGSVGEGGHFARHEADEVLAAERGAGLVTAVVRRSLVKSSSTAFWASGTPLV